MKADLCQYKKWLIDEYRLRKFRQAKPVAYMDDLYEILVTHWVWDDAVFADERQRVQLATGLLMAACFGCRPCSMFDTRVGLGEVDGSNTDNIDGMALDEVDMASDAVMGLKVSENTNQRNHLAGSDDESDDSTLTDSDDDSENGTDITVPEDSDSESGTDDGYDAGDDATGSILYRHIELFVVRNPLPEGPNIVLMKVTLVHTKGEDNRPRM